MIPELFLLIRDAEDLACRLDRELAENERIRFDEGDPKVIRDLIAALPERSQNEIVEQLIWQVPSEHMPDDDLTVLLHLEDEEYPVWPGYHDGDDGWRLADGMLAPTVIGWAHMPTGGR